VDNYIQLPIVALDSALVERTLLQIESDLELLAPDVAVVGSRMEETGYTLVLEGPVEQVYTVIRLWEEDSK